MIEQWGLPLVSLGAVLAWSFVLWLTRRHPAAELVMIVLSASVALLLSSLASPGVLSAMEARMALGVERVILFLSGAYGVVWAVRYWHRGGT